MEITVQMTWDTEACVWVAESEDVPGLVLESGSIDALLERVRFAVPELLALNNTKAPLTLTFQSERHERLVLLWPNMKSESVRCFPKTAVPLSGAAKGIMTSGVVPSASGT